MFCPKCGTEIKDGVFCPKCGTKIGGEKQQVNQTQMQTVGVGQAGMPPQKPTRTVEKKKKPVNKKILGILTAVIAVVVLVIVFICCCKPTTNFDKASGKYAATITYNNKIYEIKVSEVDTIAPEMTVERKIEGVERGTTIYPEDYVEVDDVSKVILYFVAEDRDLQSLEVPEDLDNSVTEIRYTVVAVDEAGNRSEELDVTIPINPAEEVAVAYPESETIEQNNGTKDCTSIYTTNNNDNVDDEEQDSIPELPKVIKDPDAPKLRKVVRVLGNVYLLEEPSTNAATIEPACPGDTYDYVGVSDDGKWFQVHYDLKDLWLTTAYSELIELEEEEYQEAMDYMKSTNGTLQIEEAIENIRKGE